MRSTSSDDRWLNLGPAKTGIAQWRMQRVTAVALIPLTLWFISQLIATAGRGYDAFIAWMREPFTAIFMIALLIALLYHMALGLQVVIEDYVHSIRLRLPAVLVMKLACLALAVIAVVSVLRIALSR